jgi:hypothetical protein
MRRREGREEEEEENKGRKEEKEEMSPPPFLPSGSATGWNLLRVAGIALLYPKISTHSNTQTHKLQYFLEALMSGLIWYSLVVLNCLWQPLRNSNCWAFDDSSE